MLKWIVLPTSESESSILELADLPLDPLIQKMNTYSTMFRWPDFVEDDNTDAEWFLVLALVVTYLTSALEETTLKGKVIAPLNLVESKSMLSALNKEELNKWKAATRRAVKTNDWTHLIRLSVYLSDYSLGCSY